MDSSGTALQVLCSGFTSFLKQNAEDTKKKGGKKFVSINP